LTFGSRKDETFRVARKHDCYNEIKKKILRIHHGIDSWDSNTWCIALRETCSTEATHLSLVLDLPVSLSDAIWTKQHRQRTTVYTRIMKGRNPCKRERTVNALHLARSYIHTCISVCVLALLLNYPLLLHTRAYSPRARTHSFY